MEKLKTGVKGLDKITKGGLPENQLILLTGTSGTGKTTLCSQYIYEGAKNYDEPGVFLSFEEPAEYIKKISKSFGWDFDTLEKQKKIAFIKYDPYKIEDVLDVLESTIREMGAKRVAIDSISSLGIYVRDKAELRRLIFDIAHTLRRLDCTCLLVSEMVPGEPGISRYGVEEFVADSVLVMYYERLHSAFTRAIQVWKLLGSDHSLKIHPYRITSKGLEVFPDEEAFVA